jgi:hypothetical protein
MTGKVLTEKFKSQNAIDFWNSLNTQRFYMMASCIDNPNGDVVNCVADKNEFMRRVIFGNKITRDDARFLFRKIAWESGKVYTQYDDQVDLTDKDYYVTILTGEIDAAEYRVYKCILNNAGNPSTVSPSTVSFGEDDDGYFGTSDGYVWKYMFSVLPSEYTKYQTIDQLPYRVSTPLFAANDGIYGMEIIENSEVALSLFSQFNLGQCQVINVFQESDGTYAARIQVPNTSFIRTEANAYVGMYLEINGTVYDIVGSTKPTNTTDNVLVLRTDKPINISSQTKCFVKPKIIMTESNTGGTSAICSGILDGFGRLAGVFFNSHGSGYTYAKATLSLPSSLQKFAGSVELRPIISPDGGHGSDPIIELKMSTVGIVSNFVSTPDTATPATNTYTQVGLVKEPAFSNLSDQDPLYFDNRKVFVVAGDITPSVAQNYYLYQESDSQLQGRVHELVYDEELNLTYVYVTDYVGATYNNYVVGTVFAKETPDSETSVSFVINTIEEGEYVNSSGTLLHYVSFDPISRTTNNVEKVKFIFDF